MAIALQLGDIIEIKAPNDPKYNNKTFFIDFINSTKINIINVKTLAISQLEINPDSGRLDNKDIHEIDLISRAASPSYARQNGLLPGTWINLVFDDGSYPIMITGEITDLDEDMIEIRTYPDKEVIYINFAYSGLPSDLHIRSIEVRPAPTIGGPSSASLSPNGVNSDEEEEDEEEEATTKRSREVIDASNIHFSQESLGPIVQYVDVNQRFQRYSIDTQLTDLLDDILSNIPTANRTNRVMTDIHILLERYKQLRTMYSRFDENGNIEAPLYRTANYKPLAQWFTSLDSAPQWIIPVVKNRKKVYYTSPNELVALGGNDDNTAGLLPIDYEQDLADFYEIVKNYRGSAATAAAATTATAAQGQNRLTQLYTTLTPFMTPYENIEVDTVTTMANDDLLVAGLPIHTDHLFAIMNNDGTPDEFRSAVYSKADGGITANTAFATQTYIAGMTKLATKYASQGGHKQITERVKMTPNEELDITGFIVLPLDAIKYSAVSLPMTSIYDRANLTASTGGLYYSKIFAAASSTTTINTVDISASPNGSSPNGAERPSKDEIAEEQDKNAAFIYSTAPATTTTTTKSKTTTINHFMAIAPAVTTMSDFANQLVPRTKALFNLMRDHLTIARGISTANLVSQLEPFRVYMTDLVETQQRDITKYMQTAIKQYNRNFIANTKAIGLLRQYKNRVAIPKTLQYPLFGILGAQSDRETVITDYDLGNQLALKDANDVDYSYTNSEIILAVRAADYGRLFNNLVSLQNVALMLPDNIAAMLETATATGNAPEKDKEKEEKKKCAPVQIAKTYAVEREVEADNGNPNIYWDAKYDRTNYSLLDDDKLAKKITELSAADFMAFLIGELRKKYKLTEEEAAYMAETLINGRKRVINGQYAVLIYSAENETVKYFIRKSNQWIKTDEPPFREMDVTDEAALCNIRDDCMATIGANIAVDDKCNTVESTKAAARKALIKQILEEFDERFGASIEKLRKSIEFRVGYDKRMLPVLRRLALNARYQFNMAKIRVVATAVAAEKEGVGGVDATEAIVQSPYAPVRDLILAQPDFVKKQYDIVKFVNTCTRTGYTHVDMGPLGQKETDHWLYCVQTNVPLLPTFLYTLATVYVETPEDYGEQMDLIISKIGRISDDGNMIVDMHSGYVIRTIEYSSDEGFDDAGFKIKTKGAIEPDAAKVAASTTSVNSPGDDDDAALVEQAEEPVRPMSISSVAPTDSLPVKLIKTIVNYLSHLMGINMSQQMEFIIRTVLPLFDANLPNEANYNRAMRDLANMGKTKAIVPYDDIFNSLLLYLTLGTFFVALQTSIPQIHTRKTFPNCIRSFSGYPYDGEGDMSGINYLACILTRIKNTTAPWSVLLKKPEGRVAQSIRGHIEKYLMGLPEVRAKMDEKAQYIETHVAPEQEQYEVYNVANKWAQFMPPLSAFRLAPAATPVSDQFKSALMTELRTGTQFSAAVTQKMLVLRSKVIQYGLAIQEAVQEVVATQEAVLHKMNNEPYLENACCINAPRAADGSQHIQTAVQFFIAKRPEIAQYNDQVREYAAILQDLAEYTKAPQLWCPINDKTIYTELPTAFSERTVYNAYVAFCNFRNVQPVPEVLQTYCRDKPDNIFPNDTLNDIIIKLKADGRHYTYEGLLKFLQIVQGGHIMGVAPILGEPVETPAERVKGTLGVAEQTLDDARKMVNSTIGYKVIDLLRGALDDGSSATAEAATKAVNNYLLTQLPIMQARITDFMGQNKQNRVKNLDASAMRQVARFFQTFQEWEQDDLTAVGALNGIGGNVFNKFEFYAESIRQMALVFPQMILAGVSRMSDVIPAHWRLGERHQRDLREIISAHYMALHTLMSSDVATGMRRLLETAPGINMVMAFLAGGTKNLFVSSRTSMYLMQYYVYQVFMNYIALAERADMSVVVVPETRSFVDMDTTVGPPNYFMEGDYYTGSATDSTTMRQQTDMIYQGNRKVLRGDVAYMLSVFIGMMTKQKEMLNISNNTIKDIVMKTQEREKDMITGRLEVMTDEERAADKLLQKFKIGEIWGKGLQKGFLEYNRDEYESGKDRAFVEDMQKFERAQMDRRSGQGRLSMMDDYDEADRARREQEMDADAYDIAMPADGEGVGDYDYDNGAVYD